MFSHTLMKWPWPRKKVPQWFFVRQFWLSYSLDSFIIKLPGLQWKNNNFRLNSLTKNICSFMKNYRECSKKFPLKFFYIKSHVNILAPTHPQNIRKLLRGNFSSCFFVIKFSFNSIKISPLTLETFVNNAKSRYFKKYAMR